MNHAIAIGQANRKKFPLLLFSFYLFLYLFLPPVTRVNLRVLLSLFNILFIIWSSFSNGRIIVSKRAIKSSVGFVAFFFFYILLQIIRFFLDFTHSEKIAKATLSNTLLLIHIVSACLMLVVMCKKYNMTFSLFLKSLTGAGMIELIFVLLALFFPSLKSQFIQLIVKNSRSDEVLGVIERFSYERSFGFADNLFDSFGYITALIIGLTFLSGISEKNKKTIIIALIFLIMPLLNSRSGLLLAIAGLLIVFLSYFRIRNILGYIIAGIVLAFAGVFAWRRIPENTVRWVTTGMNQTWLFLTGRSNSGIYNELLHKDMQFPSTFLLGAGYRPEEINIIGIDSGYAQLIWRYGFIGTTLLFIAIIYYFAFFAKYIGEKKVLVSFLLLLAIFFVYMFKLFGLVNTGADLIFFGVPIVAYFSSAQDKTMKWKGPFYG